MKPIGFPGKPRQTCRPSDAKGGFALIVTVSILVLLALIAVGMLTLSTVQVRTSTHGAAQAEARANARLAMMIAIGELQKALGPDQRISAPAGIADSSPETESIDGVQHPWLTGVWQSRRDQLGDTPEYERDAPFQQWLVSHQKPADVEDFNFATNGSFDEPVVMVDSPPSQTDTSNKQATAGLVKMKGGAHAWWVGDDNCKARVNARDLQEREDNQSTADLVASLNTPGPHGIQALPEFEKFDSNSEQSDKILSLAGLDLADPATADPADYFHHLTPHSESLLTNVTTGGLRKDLSLFLERTDLDWESPWGRGEGVRRQPNGPIGPNGKIALSPPTEYDVLGWKTLYHWYNMHRQIPSGRQLEFRATDGNASVDPVSNPAWNSGVTLPTPVVARIQMLLSYGSKASNTRGEYQLALYGYPVLTLWNPYNVSMTVPEYSVFLHTFPLEHKIYVNGRQVKEYKWGWNESGATSGRTVLRLQQNSPLTLRPGEARILTYTTAQGGGFTAHDMVPSINPYRPDHAGWERSLGSVRAGASDRITIETRASRWETSGTSYGGAEFQTTFGFRCEHKNIHRGHPERFRQQMFCSQVCWRRERSNPAADIISQTNFPSRTVGSVLDAPTPFLHLDVRLKTLDEPQLPNKLWSQCIPSHPFASATSSSKHRRQGVDANTTFFAHPYTVTFEEKTTPEGLFQSEAHIGTSNSAGGQTFITDREIPFAPLTSLAQLQNLPQYPMEGLNWSGYFFQNHAIGNSFANPGLASDQVKRTSIPFYLGEYFAWQAGDLTGQLYSDRTAFNVADYDIRFAPAAIIDRSYAANHLLWDDYFFSSIAGQDDLLYRSFGSGQRGVDTVMKDFFEGTTQLPNAVYQPHFGSGLTPEDILAELGGSRGNVSEDAHLKSAAFLKVAGGFNINSTSVPAWKAVLGAAHLKRVVILDAPGGRRLQQQPAGKFVVSRFSLPNGPAADNSANDEDLRWRGYRELTEEEIEELAQAIVRQVKQRGPFRSLGEFVNRRLGSSSDETSLYGALQAALEDDDVTINDNYRDLEITEADIAGANYEFKEAALGSRYQGAPPYVTQADLLMNMGPVINARSDTFTVRAYGESRTPDGNTVRARAWCEVVVQRQPEYLDSEDVPETPFDDLDSDANKTFGRQLKVKAFRWLSESEINNQA